MIFFTNTNLLTTRTTVEQTTQEVTSTLENTTTAVFTTELITSTTEKTTEALIPIMESKKDIILLAMAGTIFLAIIIMILIFVCRRQKPKRRENLELFESLAASSSTTVFDKDQ